MVNKQMKPQNISLVLTTLLAGIFVAKEAYHGFTPPLIQAETKNVSYTFNPSCEGLENKHPLICIEARGIRGEGIKEILLFYKINKDFVEPVNMQQILYSHTYAASLPPLPKGKTLYYYIQIKNASDREIKIPENAPHHPLFYIKFKQEPQRWLLILSFLCLLASFVCLVFAFYHSSFIFFTKPYDFHISIYITRATNLITAGIIILFIKVVPLDIILNYQTIGILWSGFPLSWNIIDNKLIFTLALWAIVLLIPRRLHPKTFAIFVSLCFILTLFIYSLLREPLIK